MIPILRVRDANGNIVNIPALVGPQGPQGETPPMDTTLTKSGYAADAAAVGVSIGQTRAGMERVESHNIWNIANVMPGYVDLAGTFHDSATLKYSVFDVAEGDIIRCYSWAESYGYYSAYSMRFVTAYSTDGVVSSVGAENVSSYTVPSGITRLIITINIATVSPFITKNTEYIPTDPYEYFEPCYKASPEFVESALPVYNGSWRYTGSLADGDEILFPINNIKKNTVFSFSGTVETLGTLTLGRKSGSTVYGHVEIDSTSIKVYTAATTLKTTFTHGLTLSNNVQVKLETRPAGELSVYTMYQIRVRLVTGGSEYLSDWVQFDGQSKGSPYIAVSGGSFASVSASWAAGDADCNIYAFGDSYFSFYSGRWTKFLYNDGYIDNVLLNAYAGENSSDGLQAFRNVMKLGHPGFCFWCMGMNDADSGAVNSNWKNAYHAMIGYCNDHGITPILATIPCTPANDNTYKNAVIRSSGYRYVDFAKAVGAESAGSGWYSGMLSSDNVHPTDAGALALYMQILADFPEIMV